MVFSRFKRQEPHEGTVVAPCVNIFEQDNQLVLAFDMPGTDKDSLDVQLRGKQLSIRGKVQDGDLGTGYVPIYQERFRREYARAFEFNTEVEQDKINAEYKDGVLRVRLPLRTTLPRKIEIQE